MIGNDSIIERTGASTFRFFNITTAEPTTMPSEIAMPQPVGKPEATDAVQNN